MMKQVLFQTMRRADGEVKKLFSGKEAFEDLARVHVFFIGSEADGKKVRLYFDKNLKKQDGATRGRLRWYMQQCGATGASEDMKGGRCFYLYKCKNEDTAKYVANYQNAVKGLASKISGMTVADITTGDVKYASTGGYNVESTSGGVKVAFRIPYSAAKAEKTRTEETKAADHELSIAEKGANTAEQKLAMENAKSATVTGRMLRYAGIGAIGVAVVILGIFIAKRGRK